MAIVSPSALVQSISGRLGGTVFAQSKNGIVARQRQFPHRNNVLYAHYAKAQFAACTRAWAGLPDTIRAQWRDAAEQTSRPGRTGARRPYTGFQLFLHFWMTGYITRHSPSTMTLQPIVTAPELALLATMTAPSTATINVFPSAETGTIFCAIYGGISPSPNGDYRPKTLHLLTRVNRSGLPSSIYNPWVIAFGSMRSGQGYWLECRSYLSGRIWSPPIYTSGTIG